MSPTPSERNATFQLKRALKAEDECRALQARVAELEDELGSSTTYTLNELQAKVCGLAGERDRLAARVAELETACDLARTAANFLSAERDIIAAELAAALAQVPAELSLNIIRKWPDGFQKRLDHVWKDVDGFIPNVKLYDLQRTLAEFGFTMKVYEQAAPEVK